MSPKVKLFSSEGLEKGSLELPENIFGSRVHSPSVYYSVKKILASKRQGNASTKRRGEVRGGGRKPWRQKHTGRARAGSTRSPLWKGGGVTFGPKPKDWSFKIPKKVKKLAIASAFLNRTNSGNFFVIEHPVLEQPKTKTIVQILKNIGIYGSKVLLLHNGRDKNLFKSSRNIKDLTCLEAYKSNPYIILKHKYILCTTDGLEQLKEVFK